MPDSVVDLARRVAELETENRRLRQLVPSVHWGVGALRFLALWATQSRATARWWGGEPGPTCDGPLVR